MLRAASSFGRAWRASLTCVAWRIPPVASRARCSRASTRATTSAASSAPWVTKMGTGSAISSSWANSARSLYQTNPQRTGIGEAYIVYGRSKRFKRRHQRELHRDAVPRRILLRRSGSPRPDPADPGDHQLRHAVGLGLRRRPRDGLWRAVCGLVVGGPRSTRTAISAPARWSWRRARRLRPDLGFPGRQVLSLGGFRDAAALGRDVWDRHLDGPLSLCGRLHWSEVAGGAGGRPKYAFSSAHGRSRHANAEFRRDPAGLSIQQRGFRRPVRRDGIGLGLRLDHYERAEPRSVRQHFECTRTRRRRWRDQRLLRRRQGRVLPLDERAGPARERRGGLRGQPTEHRPQFSTPWWSVSLHCRRYNLEPGLRGRPQRLDAVHFHQRRPGAR